MTQVKSMSTGIVGLFAFAVLAGTAGCCPRPASEPPPPSPLVEPATQHAERPPRPNFVQAEPTQADGATMSIMEHECMAHRISSVWASAGGGEYAVAYIDRKDPSRTLYVFNELRGNDPDLPGFGIINGGVFIEEADLHKYQLVAVVAPVRFLPREDGNFTPGFFDPGHGVFFGWRGEVRTPKAANVYFDPSDDPISPVLDPKRVVSTVDIDPPADAAERAPDW